MSGEKEKLLAEQKADVPLPEMILGTLIVIAASNMVSAVAGLRMGLIVCGAVLLGLRDRCMVCLF